MPPPTLPSGRYLTCTWAVRPNGGGQMRALLARNRLIHQAGHMPWILSFVPTPDLDESRAALLESEQMLPGTRLDSIYDYYREEGWPDELPVGEPLADLSGRKVDEQPGADGSPWRVTYQGAKPLDRTYDYLRSDGSPFLRIPYFSFADPATWPERIERVSPEGLVVGRPLALGQWFKGWVQTISAGEPSFLFIETRVLTPHLVPIKGKHLHVVQIMHNTHTLEPQRWDSPVALLGQMLLDRISDLDALVTLTERQRDEISLRLGATNNMFVVPNPVKMPSPSSAARDPRLATIVARLAGQKRLTHAITAFQEVLVDVPDARLEIFGDGSDRALLEGFIEKRGLAEAVILKGYDRQARAALDRSSVFLMTSRNEGFPLSTLESMSHGCPVVSYDIRYGPKEQITDGVDGFLVPDGDITALAQRVTQLLTSPEQVAEMSRAAVLKAQQHSPAKYAEDWARVLHAVVRQKPDRTRIDSADLSVTCLSVTRPGRLERFRHIAGSPTGVYPDDAVLALEGVLRLRGRGAAPTLRDARVEVSAVREIDGTVVDLPTTVTREGKDFTVAASAPLSTILGVGGAAERAHLRCRLVWQNSASTVKVTRPLQPSEGVEVAFLGDETLQIQRQQAPEGV